MATVRMFVDQQLLLTIFLVALLWSLYAQFRRQDFFRFWAWAWTSFAAYLGIGALVLQLAPTWSFLKGSLILASLACGFLQIPLLAFGACALRGPGKYRWMWLRAGIALALAASALIFTAALYCRDKPLVSFALRTAPRTLALAAVLFFCAWVFVGQWRRNRSLAALITASFCSLYALDQSFYSLIYVNQLVSGLPPPVLPLPFILLLSPLPFSLDLIFEFGICLGIVLLLVEEHQRAELALVKSDAHAQMLAESNAALETEIIERERAEGALRESEERFRKLVETLPDAILVHCQDRIVFVNPFCMRLLAAQQPGELIGKDILEIHHPEYVAAVKRRMRDCYQTGVASPPMEHVLISLDGSQVDVESSAIPIPWAGSTAIEVVIRDIRERKQAERAAQEWQKRLELAQKAGLRIGLWDWDLTANTVIWSDETYRHWGYTRDTFSGQVEDVVTRIYPEDWPRVEEAIRKVRAGGPEYAAQYRVVRPDGTTCWIDDYGVLIRDGPAHMIGIGIDITAQKNTEQSLQEAKLELARVIRIATMGELTASIAHEINQPLAAVVINGDASLRWLAMQPPNLEEAREAVTRTIQEANRASEVTQRVRALLQKATPEMRPLDINETIREVLALTSNELLQGGVSVQTELATDVPNVRGDRVQFQQVMLNLIMNGIEAMNTISGRKRELLIKSAKHPDGVLIQVQDSGTGLDPEQTDRVFTPFFTTKPRGIGMGLSISRSIVEAHGGRLWATRGPSYGAVFQFTLPKADTSDERAA